MNHLVLSGRLRLVRAAVQGLVPVDAGVGDALAVDQRFAGDELLRAGDEIALDHDADDVASPAAICAATSRQTSGWRV